MSVLHELLNRKAVMNKLAFESDCIEVDEKLRKQIQNALLGMLKDFDGVCSKHGISYFICGGSCLGAVRHKGFIPWDDDIDIAMTRAQYVKFIRIFDMEMGDKYILNAPNYSNNSITRFPKILKKDSIYITGDTNIPELQKLYIDIFIAENIPDNHIVRTIKGCMCNCLEFISGQVIFFENSSPTEREIYKNNNVLSYCIRRFVAKAFAWVGVSRFNNLIDTIVQHNDNSTKLCGFPTGRKHYFGEFLPREILQETIRVPFEDCSFPIPKDFHFYLKNLYGDYMRIPPEDKREKHFIKKCEL